MSDKVKTSTTQHAMDRKTRTLCSLWPLWLKSVCLPPLLSTARPYCMVALRPLLPKTVSKRRKSSHAPDFPAENRGSRGRGDSLKRCQSVANRCQTSRKSLSFETPVSRRVTAPRPVSAQRSGAYTDSRLGGRRLRNATEGIVPPCSQQVNDSSPAGEVREGKSIRRRKTTPCHLPSQLLHCIS
jgi:hypothetical protein